MRLEQLHYVLTIVRYGSLSSAAEKLFINQPTLSRAVHALEQELGIDLFERTHQGMVPTSICKKLISHFENIICELQCIDEIIAQEKNQDVKGSITISTTAMIANNILLDIIDGYNTQYPLVTVNVSEQYSEKIINEVYNKISLVGVLTYMPRMENETVYACKNNNLIFEPLFTTPLVSLLPAVSTLATEEIVTDDMLESIPLIVSNKVPLPMTDEVMESELTKIHYCYDRDSRNKMILKYNGYAIISPLEMWNDPYLESNLLVLKPYAPSEPGINPMTVGLVYEKNRKLYDFEQDFIDHLRIILLRHAHHSRLLEPCQ